MSEPLPVASPPSAVEWTHTTDWTTCWYTFAPPAGSWAAAGAAQGREGQANSAESASAASGDGDRLVQFYPPLAGTGGRGRNSSPPRSPEDPPMPEPLRCVPPTALIAGWDFSTGAVKCLAFDLAGERRRRGPAARPTCGPRAACPN